MGLLIAWAVAFRETWKIYYDIIARQLTKKTFSPQSITQTLSAELEEKLRTISQESNVVVYGGFNPFISAGYDIGRWSFSINKQKGKDKDHPPKPFTVDEIYIHLINDLKETKIPGIVIKKTLFVQGKGLQGNNVILPNKHQQPVFHLGEDELHAFSTVQSDRERYFSSVQVPYFGAELTFSIFFKFTIIGKDLYTEANYFLLTPLKEEYYLSDTLEPSVTLKKCLEILRKSFLSIFLIPFNFSLSLVGMLREAIVESFNLNSVKKQIDHNPNFNYGAQTSLRVQASSGLFREYFQKADKEMYVKILERQLLESINTFLMEKHIDIGDLKSQQTTIINNGIINQGKVKTKQQKVENNNPIAKFFGGGGSPAQKQESPQQVA